MHLENKKAGGTVLDITLGLVTLSSDQPVSPNTGQSPLTRYSAPTSLSR